MIDNVIEKLGRLKNKFFSGIFYLMGISLILTSLGVVCFQLFLYLYKGGWTSIQLQSVLAFAPYDLYAWVVEPTSWLGLHKIVKWVLDIPMAFFCFIVGYLLMKLSDFIALFSD
jgi:hypothetical protein